MQVDKTGKIINSPQYKIHGDNRRKLKKQLASKKHAIREFWRFVDLDNVYGGGIFDADPQQRFGELKKEITEMENLLSIKFIPE